MEYLKRGEIHTVTPRLLSDRHRGEFRICTVNSYLTGDVEL